MKLYLFVALISKILGTLIPPVYNFGNQQNYEIDLLYNHLLGRNIYFPDDPANTKTQFIVTIYPSLSLELKFKFYTGNSDITQALNSGKYVYFGLDLNITNTDKSLEKYNTDVIACEMTKSDAVCYDYVYDKTDSKYKRNQNGNLSKNNLIPLGFNNIELNILTQNVINFDNYYSISFVKEYPENFDNITMFNWINYVGSDMEHYISAFYGIASNSEEWKEFTSTQAKHFKTVLYEDGSGLQESSSGYLKVIFVELITIIGIILL